MRLDHLLSKEQLTCESGSVACVAHVWWRGAHVAETLANYQRATAGELSTRASTLVGEPLGGTGDRCGWQIVMSTLLSPERTTLACSWWRWWPRSGWVLFFLQAWPGIAYRFSGSRRGGGCWGFGVVRCGLWVGRWLRIAQWTRASLWSSCQGRTVDALAPGADEGRGRPR